jgi:selenocysteine lyase/cysteine desulfurase
VTSFRLAHLDPGEIAAALDVAAGIECRSGLHCAPRMHGVLGTASSGGTARISLGPFNTAEQINVVVSAIADLASTH